MDRMERIFKAYLDGMNTVVILLPYHYYNGDSSRFFLEKKDEKWDLEIHEIIPLEEEKKYICHTQHSPQFGCTYYIIDEHGNETDLQIGAVIRSPEFDQIHYDDLNDFGCSYSKSKSVFKVWAPTATDAFVKMIGPDEKEETKIPMVRSKKGTWTAEIDGDLEGVKYRYSVKNNLEWKEAVDPYTKAVSVNSEWGIVVDMTKTRMDDESLRPELPIADAIIYEANIRDLTSHPNSGIVQKRSYNGLAERNTVGSNQQKTGLSFVSSLGVTHLELLPFNDFYGIPDQDPASMYNWGYNPLFFNVPEGSYSTDPTDPYTRINELKNMIRTIHEEGLSVIMDVVYNHVYVRETSSFEILVPGYYFRHDLYGTPANGTGVGNDFASEKLMARKFIVDSVRYWMKEYMVDGFRFDLMGILDIGTLKEVSKAASDIYPHVLLLGEGWELNTPLPANDKANIRNANQLQEVAFFNDFFRDTVKGSTFDLYERGYALGHSRLVRKAIQVMTGRGVFNSPLQSINYIESHDNHTLWDKIQFCFPNQEERNIKRHRLATSIVLLSQGIPFIHAGQEFFRTKNGVDNSYKHPDEVNWMDWDRSYQYKKNVDYIRRLISMRKQHKAFRLETLDEIRKYIEVFLVDENVIGLHLKEVGVFGPCNHIAILVNPEENGKEAELPEVEGKWTLWSDGEEVWDLGKQIVERKILLEPISCKVYAAR
ncbi:type I pullulanase [Falsibacillus albus]|uniref:Type I pullulanase n=1 Tax=Falsibacillus albus TaxID=2478915 RepID=A0A3L7K4D7_9BACI|nr:type I pullulanase [Falsibacillus albus]RLQ97888.1 type I pullulanase [Falsibacillus albus]